MVDNSDSRTQMILQELVRRTNDHARRVRDTENKIQTMEDKLNSLEENLINKTKKINDRFTDLEATLKTTTDEMIQMKNLTDKINNQISNFARKRDIKELESMFELLNPIRQEFITREELEKFKRSEAPTIKR